MYLILAKCAILNDFVSYFHRLSVPYEQRKFHRPSRFAERDMVEPCPGSLCPAPLLPHYQSFMRLGSCSLTHEKWADDRKLVDSIGKKYIILTDVNNHQHHTIDSFTKLTERPNFTDRSKPADQSYIACISRVQAFSISAKVT